MSVAFMSNMPDVLNALIVEPLREEEGSPLLFGGPFYSRAEVFRCPSGRSRNRAASDHIQLLRPLAPHRRHRFLGRAGAARSRGCSQKGLGANHVMRVRVATKKRTGAVGIPMRASP